MRPLDCEGRSVLRPKFMVLCFSSLERVQRAGGRALTTRDAAPGPHRSRDPMEAPTCPPSPAHSTVKPFTSLPISQRQKLRYRVDRGSG